MSKNPAHSESQLRFVGVRAVRSSDVLVTCAYRCEQFGVARLIRQEESKLSARFNNGIEQAFLSSIVRRGVQLLAVGRDRGDFTVIVERIVETTREALSKATLVAELTALLLAIFGGTFVDRRGKVERIDGRVVRHLEERE